MSALYYPTHVNLETSDACNRRCAFCPVPRAPGGPVRELSLALLEDLLQQLGRAPWPLKIALHWGDEPLASPRFDQVLELCRRRLPRATWLLQTNGDALTAERLRALRGFFAAIAINLYDAHAARRLQALGLDDEGDGALRRHRHPGQLVRGPGLHPTGAGAVVVNHKYRDRDWLERPVAPGAQTGLCTHLWHDVAVGHDGRLYLCCRDSLRQHPVGDLRRRSLVEAFNGREATRLRARMQAGQRARIAMCRCCPIARFKPFAVVPLASPGGPRDGERSPRAGTSAAALPSSPRASRRGQRTGSAASTGALPWGRHDYWSARQAARARDHLALPGFFPRRYEIVIGLEASLARHLVDTLRRELGAALRAVWICGSRVLTRPQQRLLDPAVFDPGQGGTLSLRGDEGLREFGRDVRRSSDLDLKILIAQGALDPVERERLAHRLGTLLDAASAAFPLSGHRVPRHRLLEVPAGLRDPRRAFAAYNRGRAASHGKGPHSLQAAVLLDDPRQPVRVIAQDARAAVRACLVPRARGGRRVELASLRWPARFAALDDAGRLRAGHAGLCGHQWIGALLDLPDHEPPGIRVAGSGRIIAGAVAAWAAREAGRGLVAVEG